MRISDERLKFIAAGKSFKLSTSPSWQEAIEMARELQQLRASHESLWQSLTEILNLAKEWGKEPTYYTQAEENLIGFAEDALANAQKVREG